MSTDFITEKILQFIIRKGKERKIESRLLQGGKLNLKLLLIPLRNLCNLVVGDSKRLLLFRCKVSRDDARHRLPTKLLTSKKPRMPLNDDLILVENRRVSEPEFLDDIRKLLHRTFVYAGVVLVRNNLIYWNIDYSHFFSCHLFSISLIRLAIHLAQFTAQPFPHTL